MTLSKFFCHVIFKTCQSKSTLEQIKVFSFIICIAFSVITKSNHSYHFATLLRYFCTTSKWFANWKIWNFKFQKAPEKMWGTCFVYMFRYFPSNKLHDIFMSWNILKFAFLYGSYTLLPKLMQNWKQKLTKSVK